MPLGMLFKRQPFLSRSCPPRPYQANWSEETFIKSDEAEAALCADRFAFVLRNDIMVLIPDHIKKRIIHPDANVHIHGFQELFVYLNKDRGVTVLRQLIEAYFNDSAPFHGHLSQLSPMVGILSRLLTFNHLERPGGVQKKIRNIFVYTLA
jgi:hypothetical protein